MTREDRVRATAEALHAHHHRRLGLDCRFDRLRVRHCMFWYQEVEVQAEAVVAALDSLYAEQHADSLRIIEGLERVRARLCCYVGSTCDCKYGFGDPNATSEATGCPELRDAIDALADALSPTKEAADG